MSTNVNQALRDQQVQLVFHQKYQVLKVYNQTIHINDNVHKSVIDNVHFASRALRFKRIITIFNQYYAYGAQILW